MEQNELSLQEKERYSRHLAIPNFRAANQLGLKNSSVVVIGAGGLGVPVLMYLAAAGIGHIGIVEHDTIDQSNLQRQVLYREQNVSQPKLTIAHQELKARNSNVQFSLFDYRLTRENAMDVIEDFDLVIDCTDNFPTRYLINDACVLANKPLVYGSVFRFEGQVAVFNVTKSDGFRSTNYRDLFPHPPNNGSVLNCEEGGVFGAICGMIGSLQAAEAIKLLSGVGEPLHDRLLMIDIASFNTTLLKIKQRNDYQITELIDYEQFCGVSKKTMAVKEITVEELKIIQLQNTDYQLIDVREAREHFSNNIDGELIPIKEIIKQKDKIAIDKKVIIYCLSGKRSATAITQLQEAFGLGNLYNLKGGIQAWRRKYGND